MSPLSAAVVLLFVGFALLTLGFVGLSHQVAVVIEQVRSASAITGGAGVVGFRLPAASRLNDLLPIDGELMAVFVSEHCAGCIGLVRELVGAEDLIDLRSRTVLISDGSCGPFADRFEGPCMPDAGAEHTMVGVAAVPWMVRVGADGTVLESRVVRGIPTLTSGGTDGEIDLSTEPVTLGN